MNKDSVLSAQEIHAVRRSFAEAATLPPKCYTSSEWYDQEIEKIFLREWVCVGRVEQIPNAGDYFTLEVARERLILVRGEQGAIHAHLNVCRHRGATVVDGGKGNCRAFRCPYHSWTYALDGKLIGTPGRDRPMDGVEKFSRSDYGLRTVKVDVWAGFVFINFDSRATGLLSWLGDLPERLKNYKLEDMVCTRQVATEVASNWKLPIENFLEGYHVDTVHAKHIARGYPQKWVIQESRGPYMGNYLVNSVARMKSFPTIDGLNQEQLDGVYHYWLIPNVKLSLTSTYMKYFLYLPDGPNRHRLLMNWCFPRATIQQPGFQEEVGPAVYGRGTIKQQDGEWVDEIVVEDNLVLERCQHGLSSRWATAGRYGRGEDLVHSLANYVLDRVVGKDGGRSSPAA